MRILAIETSCDETAIALIDAKGGLNNPQFKIIKNLVASQIKIHQPFGGVVPNLAKREHLKNLPILFKKILNSKSYILNSIDLIAVTVGPGLEPALWTGINFAKNLKSNLIGVNHLEGHLYSNILENVRMNKKNIFPAIALIVSGGHTILVKMDSLAKYKKIGETRDDAVGEAFDKVARLLNLPYPGGPEIEKLAKIGNADAIDFPRPMLNQKNYDFSFSGLKTAVLYYLRDNKNFKKEDVAAAFQKAAFDILIKKTLRAAKEFNAKSIFISGGVAANKTLAKEFKKAINNQKPKTNPPAGGEKLKIKVFFPNKKFCTDNAVMIAVAGYINYLKKKNKRLAANGNLGL
ncbi:MAG: tRNA (adenosine(37)-N6)-threonylcarbamoyltransferase complex transferase subunit TsaD [Patescibacteria group bacterium]|nr:tRNA (adenosine(37)-N6)-threonylcarbamoyltransferase complex transferase subunit TsaD [Patescibacteria group bacterium]